jgi:hypothetical protein
MLSLTRCFISFGSAKKPAKKNDGQFHIADRAIEANPMVPGIFTLQARIAELTTTLESQDKQLMHSLSISGLDDCAAAAIRALRDRLAQGDIRFASDTVSEVETMIANLGRPEIRTLSNLLTRRAWRIHIIRWLLRVASSVTYPAAKRIERPWERATNEELL